MIGNTQAIGEPLPTSKCVQIEEGTAIILSDKVVDKIMSSMTFTLVSKFFSFRPSVDMVRKWAATKWKLKGSVMISAMPRALFLFKFTLKEDMVLILSGYWTYGKHHLSLCKWKPRFDPVADLNKFALVWDEMIFCWIANTFGHFVVVDEVTRTKSRLVFVCFCVLVAVNKNLPNFITLNSKLGRWTQAIVYENATTFFQRFSKYGHVVSNCKMVPEQPQK
ncbi:uncharacterized protein LOC131876578 [Cryptomeria japonica]|uniref:uncharacterized protein LOC131876578 n=1 Tax=Cryptomeria japonica TaxID=3369 RepID=UPI0027D9E67D|nr:uncharacterized protein LOC131876578 [Cryptomeria japonica]